MVWDVLDFFLEGICKYLLVLVGFCWFLLVFVGFRLFLLVFVYEFGIMYHIYCLTNIHTFGNVCLTALTYFQSTD